MFSKHATHALITIAFACLPLVAAEPTITPQAGVLVLRNGRVLEGEITWLGERYAVTTGENYEVRVPAADVEMHCRTLDEAYHRKLSALPPNNAQQRLQLAQWCLRQNLIARAADQLLAVWVLDSSHPQIEPLERRIWSVAATLTPTSHEPASPSLVASFDELDQVLRELPPRTVERFTNSVQPVLMNRCSTSNCHGHTSPSAFRLLRPTLGVNVTRRFTQRNLATTLQMVDRNEPLRSPLLTAPTRPHGGLSTPVFAEHDKRQYNDLVEWVRLVAAAQSDLQPATIAQPETNLLRNTDSAPMPLPNRAAVKSRRGSALATEPIAASAPPDQDATPDEPPPPSDKPQQRRSKQPFIPRDPFDPEIFNRRYFGPTP